MLMVVKVSRIVSNKLINKFVTSLIKVDTTLNGEVETTYELKTPVFKFKFENKFVTKFEMVDIIPEIRTKTERLSSE